MKQTTFPITAHIYRFTPGKIADQTMHLGQVLGQSLTQNNQLIELIAVPYKVESDSSKTFANEHEAIRIFLQLAKSINAHLTNPERIEPHCPNCGSLNITHNHNEINYNRQWKCHNCEKTAGYHTFNYNSPYSQPSQYVWE